MRCRPIPQLPPAAGLQKFLMAFSLILTGSNKSESNQELAAVLSNPDSLFSSTDSILLWQLDLALLAALSFTVVRVVAGKGEGRQPSFAPHHPAFISWHQLIRHVERADVHLDLVAHPVED